MLVRELRAIYPALPIVIATGLGQAALRSLFAGVPNIAFLEKPYTEEGLRAALRTVGAVAWNASDDGGAPLDRGLPFGNIGRPRAAVWNFVVKKPLPQPWSARLRT